MRPAMITVDNNNLRRHLTSNNLESPMKNITIDSRETISPVKIGMPIDEVSSDGLTGESDSVSENEVS